MGKRFYETRLRRFISLPNFLLFQGSGDFSFKPPLQSARNFSAAKASIV
jgi:hypothetical protein